MNERRSKKLSRLSDDEVFVYRQVEGKKGRSRQRTVKNHYIKLRKRHKAYHCDEPNCRFHKEPLIWNGKELKLELDHKNGVSGDNRLKNLRLLCPNCHSQQPTRGGGNKGKVEQSEGGFAKIREDGKKDYTLPAETGKFKLESGQANLEKESNSA